ncbi:hypothetical protein CVT24_000708 [Panaeolus cyanescens]|uniref:DNL-type domain-containing protein n=1 Tax=Panaeolus cyanescens TaxID=181874 RepID=A0A409YT25_9AGAR|nr:hypothetical protein CVT24_000708 [Panaeolus cyanescens]
MIRVEASPFLQIGNPEIYLNGEWVEFIPGKKLRTYATIEDAIKVKKLLEAIDSSAAEGRAIVLNTGLPPVLRSLITPHPSLPPTIAVQLRFNLGIIPGSYARLNSSSASAKPSSNFSAASSTNSTTHESIPLHEQQPSSTTGETVAGKEAEQTVTSQQLPGRIDPRLSITFTCTVPDCNERSTHEFSKRSYERGIVLVQCPKCKNRHLIADHLGWFKDSTDGGKLRTVEDLLASKGEKIKKGRMGEGGVIEFTD